MLVTQLPGFPSRHWRLSHALRKTNGIKPSVNIFLQLRKVKGFASLFQETRGIQPFHQRSGEHQSVAHSSEEADPLTRGGVEEAPEKLGWRTMEGTNTPSAGAVTSGGPKGLSFPDGGLCSWSTQDNMGLCQPTWHVGVTSFHPGSQERRAGATAVVTVFRPWLVVPGTGIACSSRALVKPQSSAKQPQSLKGSIQ